MISLLKLIFQKIVISCKDCNNSRTHNACAVIYDADWGVSHTAGYFQPSCTTFQPSHRRKSFLTDTRVFSDAFALDICMSRKCLAIIMRTMVSLFQKFDQNSMFRMKAIFEISNITYLENVWPLHNCFFFFHKSSQNAIFILNVLEYNKCSLNLNLWIYLALF